MCYLECRALYVSHHQSWQGHSRISARLSWRIYWLLPAAFPLANVPVSRTKSRVSWCVQLDAAPGKPSSSCSPCAALWQGWAPASPSGLGRACALHGRWAGAMPVFPKGSILLALVWARACLPFTAHWQCACRNAALHVGCIQSLWKEMVHPCLPFTFLCPPAIAPSSLLNCSPQAGSCYRLGRGVPAAAWQAPSLPLPHSAHRLPSPSFVSSRQGKKLGSPSLKYSPCWPWPWPLIYSACLSCVWPPCVAGGKLGLRDWVWAHLRDWGFCL